MVDKNKVEEVRKAIKKTIKKQKMYIENEPGFSGDPSNTIAQDENEDVGKDEKRNKK